MILNPLFKPLHQPHPQKNQLVVVPHQLKWVPNVIVKCKVRVYAMQPAIVVHQFAKIMSAPWLKNIHFRLVQIVCAGSNPPSVSTIFRFAAYLNLLQDLKFCLALLHAGRLFHSFSGNLRFYHHRITQVRLISAPLPIISDYPSPDRISCMEGGVSSAVAGFRAPAHTQ